MAAECAGGGVQWLLEAVRRTVGLGFQPLSQADERGKGDRGPHTAWDVRAERAGRRAAACESK